MKRKRHTPEQAVRELREGEEALKCRRGSGLGAAASGGHRVHLESVAQHLWRDEGRGCERAQGAARGERPAVSRSPIRAGDGARPTSSPPAKAWRSIPSALCGCGAPIVFSGPHSGATNSSASATAPRRSCEPSTPITCGRSISSSTRPPPGGASSCSTSSTPTAASKSSPRSPPDGGAPTHLRMDNGPELTADALRDWCRHTCTDTACIEPGAPWENGWIESFNGRLRDECLNIEDFANLLEARVVLEDWRHDYNHHRPHRSLGGQTPAAYAANHQPTTTTTKHP